MAGLGQQIESVDFALVEKHPPDPPVYSPPYQPVGQAQPIEDFQRALRPANRAAAMADRVVIVQEDDRNAAPSQIDRRRQTDGTGANHDDGLYARIRSGLLRRRSIVIFGVGKAGHMPCLRKMPADRAAISSNRV